MRPLVPSTVLLWAVLLLACQEQGSGPVGPEDLGPQLKKGGKPGTGGGGGTVTDFNVMLADGLVATEQQAQARRDNKTSLVLYSDDFDISIDLEETRDQDITGDLTTGCRASNLHLQPGTEAELRALLKPGLARRVFTLHIDKRTAISGAASSWNHVWVQWVGNDTPYISIGRNEVRDNYLKVLFTGDDINDATKTRQFVLKEGTVSVVTRLGTAATDPIAELLCPNVDEIVVTVEPVP